MANQRGLHTYTVQEAQNAQMGQAGSVFIENTAVHTGPFAAITAIEDSEVDVSDCTDIDKTMTDAADFTIPAGLTIYGNFAGFALDSGKVIAYKG